MKKTLLPLALVAAAFAQAHDHGSAKPADKTLTVAIKLLDGDKAAGEVIIRESKYGLVFTPALHDLPAGLHGFHIHEHPSCAAGEKDGKSVLGLAAGGHWDPHHAARHGQPWEDDTDLGNLPVLYADADGNASVPVLAPRLKTLDEIKGHALIIHVGGDNYAEHPAPLGGGGGRLACGIIP